VGGQEGVEAFHVQGEAGALHAFPLLLGAAALPESRNQGEGGGHYQRQAKEVAAQQKLAEEEEVHPREVAEEAALARSFKMYSIREERRQPRSCQNENQTYVVTFNSSSHFQHRHKTFAF
jgi:hypothetical protein